VEMWAIDAVRVGLVEGKLSQQDQTFLIHRTTYRVFGENQWKEVASRLDMWRSSLQGVLRVVRQEKENYIRDREAELREAENKGSGYRPNKQYNRSAVEVE
jgi:translation initiation factor 3 subunit M